MTNINRREFGLGIGATTTGTAVFANFAIAQGGARVVIIGGGPGGATVAAQLKREEPKLDVTLIEVRSTYTTCFFSNLYLGGFRTLGSLTHTYDGLRKLGVKIVTDTATDVDTTKKTVKLRGGRTLSYDRLVMAPGIDLKYETIEGYQAASEIMPHAWKAGTQTALLKSQLEGMRDGGVVVLAPPNNPYRCPPGPYERACMIAHFLKTKKPKSKLIILDPKRNFSKQPVFVEAFEKYYKGIIDLRLTNEIDDFTVVKVDAKTKEVTIKKGDKIKADVANIVPNQKAGDIAARAGLTEGDWCLVNPENFSSGKARDVYVLGDASVANDMPKSAFSANSQAKVVAADLLADLAKKQKFNPNFRNTCWSMLAPNDSVKIGAGYIPKSGKLEPVGAFVSKPGEDAELRRKTFEESLAWYSGITADVFAKEEATAEKGKKKA